VHFAFFPSVNLSAALLTQCTWKDGLGEVDPDRSNLHGGWSMRKPCRALQQICADRVDGLCVCWFDSSQEVIQLVVILYHRYSLSLLDMKDLACERGIDICHEAARKG
jgi:hypothetical protein